MEEWRSKDLLNILHLRLTIDEVIKSNKISLTRLRSMELVSKLLHTDRSELDHNLGHHRDQLARLVRVLHNNTDKAEALVARRHLDLGDQATVLVEVAHESTALQIDISEHRSKSSDCSAVVGSGNLELDRDQVILDWSEETLQRESPELLGLSRRNQRRETIINWRRCGRVADSEETPLGLKEGTTNAGEEVTGHVERNDISIPVNLRKRIKRADRKPYDIRSCFVSQLFSWNITVEKFWDYKGMLQE